MNLYSRTSKTKDESEHIKIHALFFTCQPQSRIWLPRSLALCKQGWHCFWQYSIQADFHAPPGVQNPFLNHARTPKTPSRAPYVHRSFGSDNFFPKSHLSCTIMRLREEKENMRTDKNLLF